jgi:hypothetical protein
MSELSTTGQAFLKDLIAAFEENNYSPIALRNYETLPSQIGKDFDLFIEPICLGPALREVISLVDQNKGEITHIHRRNYFVALWIKLEPYSQAIHIDLYHGPQQWHGLNYLSVDSLIKKKIRYQTNFEFYVPAKHHEALMLLLATLLWGGRFKEKYRIQIRALTQQESERNEFLDILKLVLGAKGKSLGLEVISQNEMKAISRSGIRKLRFRVFFHAIQSQGFTSLLDWLKHWKQECLSYLMEQPGFVLTLLEGQNTEKQVKELKNRVGDYFGEVISIKSSQNRLQNWWKRFRARGKNHLLIECSPDAVSESSENLIEMVKNRNGRYAERMLKALVHE